MYRIETLVVNDSPMEVFVFEPEGRGPFPGMVVAQHIPVGHTGLENDTFTLDVGERMAAGNIGTSVHFIPVHYHPYYREKYGWMEGMCSVAEEAFRRVVSLPLHGGLSDVSFQDVTVAVQAILDRRG